MKTQEELDTDVATCETGLALAAHKRERYEYERERAVNMAPGPEFEINARFNFADCGYHQTKVDEALAALNRAKAAAVAGPCALSRAATYAQTWQRQELLMALVAILLLIHLLK